MGLYLITMTIFKYIKINILVYIFALIAIFTASFIPFFIITTLIFIHELGHFLMAKILHVRLDKIYIYPLGGISKFYLPLNYSIVKELLILIAGPIFQCLAKILLKNIIPQEISQITYYHYGILIFNLLPIYPLDGGKLLQNILSLFFPYKKSLYYSINTSYIFILLIILINIKNLKFNIIIMTIFLIYKLAQEKKQINIIYEKFLLERYLNKYKFRKKEITDDINNLYKNKAHIIRNNGKYLLENEYLEKKYDKFKKNIDIKNYM